MAPPLGADSLGLGDLHGCAGQILPMTAPAKPGIVADVDAAVCVGDDTVTGLHMTAVGAVPLSSREPLGNLQVVL